MKPTQRTAAVAVGAAVAFALCGAVSESHADPADPPAPGLVNAGAIDTLLVSLEDIKAIPGGGGFSDSVVSQQPTASPAADPGGPCELALSGTADPAGFGTNWTAFRYADITGSNIYLRQSVGVYPDPGAAEDAFAGLVAGLKSCALSRTGSVAIASLTGSATTWLEPGDRPCAEVARVVKNVFFRVGSCRLEPAAAAVSVANQISGRITNAL